MQTSDEDSRLLAPQRAARVAIIDDHPLIRAAVASLIACEPRFEVCGEADDVASGVSLIRAAAPDLAIIDIALRRGSGIDLIRQIKAEKLLVRMLVLSMYDESLFAERALRAGAAGYINKQEVGRSIIAALTAVLNGKMYVSEELSSRLMTQAVAGRVATDANPVGVLSDRELHVFTLIGGGATLSEIAASLHVSVKTVNTYRQRIKDKLGLKSSAELSREAMHWTIDDAK